ARGRGPLRDLRRDNGDNNVAQLDDARALATRSNTRARPPRAALDGSGQPAHRNSHTRVDSHIRRVRHPSRKPPTLAGPQRRNLRARHTLLHAQPRLPNAAAPQPCALPLDNGLAPRVATARGCRALGSDDGRAHLCAGLAGRAHALRAEPRRAYRQALADEPRTGAGVESRRRGALRIYAARRRARDALTVDVADRPALDKSENREGD